MPDDKFEAQMNFILEQQARFSADVQILQESQARTDERLRQLVDVSMSLANHIEEIDQRLIRLADGLSELRDFQGHSDQRLDMLADIVRRHVESHHDNGGKMVGE
ncbi:MAG: hypothetical protein ACLQOO_36510 [Terriglobia bacterium]